MLKYLKDISLIFILVSFISISSSFCRKNDSVNKRHDTLEVSSDLKQIDKSIINFKQKKIDTNESTEGGEILGFISNDGKIRKIVACYFGETGKRTLTYYFDKAEKLFYMADSIVDYDKPIYEGKIEVKLVQVDCFYFTNKQLVLWLKNYQKIESVKYRRKGYEIINEAKTLKSKLK